MTKSSRSSQKPTGKSYSDRVTGFDLFYQLTYMSATASAGISRGKVFQLARQLPAPPARYFQEVDGLSANLRYNYPDACRIIGQRVKSEDSMSFLLRLSDALRSGEPLAPFLTREAKIQGENYTNEYERNLKSLEKWNDGYTAITVSVALIVIINMVSTMIYDMGMTTMVTMVLVAILMGCGVAWVLSRAAPPEITSVPWSQGSKKQGLCLRLAKIFVPLAAIFSLGLALLGANSGWIMILAALLLIPPGAASLLAERETKRKDQEISAFLRSLGGAASSRGTTLAEALRSIDLESFTTLESDIRSMALRLRAFGKPALVWRKFGVESGSRLINQTIGIFYEAISLGGDPEQVGILCSLFALKTTMLRAKRSGVAATFSWLTLVMHGVIAALMVFLLEIIRKFVTLLESSASALEASEQGLQDMVGQMFSFSAPQTQFLNQIATGMVLILALINAFAITASEGSHLLKILYYLSILLFLTGISYLTVPSVVQSIL